MMIIRINKTKNFSVVSNHGANNTKLSWQAKGVLYYLLSRPDDWQVYITHLSKQSTNGSHSTRAAIKELVDDGYISIDKERDTKGQFKGNNYIVNEEPVNNKPHAKTPYAENLNTDNHTLLNTDILNTDLRLNTDKIQTAPNGATVISAFCTKNPKYKPTPKDKGLAKLLAKTDLPDGLTWPDIVDKYMQEPDDWYEKNNGGKSIAGMNHNLNKLFGQVNKLDPADDPYYATEEYYDLWWRLRISEREKRGMTIYPKWKKGSDNE